MNTATVATFCLEEHSTLKEDEMFDLTRAEVSGGVGAGEVGEAVLELPWHGEAAALLPALE